MSNEGNKDPAIPARALLGQLRQNAGAYPGWSPDIVRKLTATLRGPAGRAFRDQFMAALGIDLPQVDENALTDKLLAFYGLSSSPYDSLQDLFNFSVPHHHAPPATSHRLERIVVGTLPNLMTVDPLTDEPIVSRAASGFVIPADDSYLIALSTQLSKIVIDFSALISSTGPLGQCCISPLDLLDGLGALVRLRWINSETPPTWKMKYMPEQVLADREWTLRNMLVNLTISLFLISHEVGHIILGHCDTANTADYYVGPSRVDVLRKSKGDEIAADQYAARVLAGMASALPIDSTSKKGVVTYLVLQLCKFLGFLDILAETASGPDTHPSGDARCAAVLEQFEESSPGIVDSSAVKMTMAFAGGFFGSVRSRLEEE